MVRRKIHSSDIRHRDRSRRKYVPPKMLTPWLAEAQWLLVWEGVTHVRCTKCALDRECLACGNTGKVLLFKEF